MSSAEIWIEAAAFIGAVILIPFYMGFIHIAPVGAVAYAGVGGVMMAVGEDLQFDSGLSGLSAHDILLWWAAIAGSGGIAYLIALIFI